MWAEIRQYLKTTSWPIVMAMVALMGVGILAIRVSQSVSPGLEGQASKQIVYACVALVAFLVATAIPYQRIGRVAYILFAATLVLLIVVLLLPAVRGSHRWIDLGPIQFQPSELAKLTYIIALAWYLRRGDHYRRLRGLALPFALTFVPMALILYEPDLGTSLLFLPTLYFMLFMAGAKLRHLLLFVALGAVVLLLPVPRALSNEEQAALDHGFVEHRLGLVRAYAVDESLAWDRRPRPPVAYARLRFGDGWTYDIQPLSIRVLMRGHQTDRIEGWLRQDDPRVIRNEGFQLRWSLVTLASGGLAGREDAGAARGGMLPLSLHQLPDDHTDFIFSVIGGRWGFIGCVLVLGLYAVIFVFGVEIATITHDAFARLLVVGVLGLLLTQLFINVGMTMGLMPITGMTLPMISYGGSSLVVNGAALGLLINVGRRRPILLGRRPFEYAERPEKPTRIENRTGGDMAGHVSGRRNISATRQKSR